MVNYHKHQFRTDYLKNIVGSVWKGEGRTGG
jgi:hypothetical protein